MRDLRWRSGWGKHGKVGIVFMYVCVLVCVCDGGCGVVEIVNVSLSLIMWCKALWCTW